MKTLGATRLGAIALLFCAQITSAVAVTFIHDSFISFADFSDDGQDIVVTNCTLTVDGTHTFNSVQLLNGAVLTHSPFPYGPQQFTVSVSDEMQTFSAINPAVLANTNVDASSILVFDSSASILYTEGVDYTVTISNQFTELTLTTNSAIAEGATVLVDYDWAQSFQGFNLTVSNDLWIAAGGAINVSGNGYASGIGFPGGAGTSHGTNYPFVFTAGGGGAHGGSGGTSSTFARGGAAYDSTTNPAALGSGGGAGTADGGSGGGAAALSIGGNLQVDGQIFVDGLKGTNAHGGGGAGGSLWISAQQFSGAGAISANGGSADLPDGGGGGGGRIAIYFGTNNFTGTISAFGGNGAVAGGAGTIYLRSLSNFAGQLFIVNGGKRGTNTTFSAAISDLTISGGAVAQSQTAQFSVTNLFVGSNSWLIPFDGVPLALIVNGNATMESNAVINADFKATTGVGAGSAACGAGSGGSYGGYGGASVCGTPSGAVYGSIIQPVNMGSPGGAGPAAPGGGAINMSVAGTLSLAGTISANGAPASAPTSGGGSGGGIWLTVATLAGGGTISANGGAANNLVSGGGGGGHVAVYFNTNLFTGNILARGGAGTNAGGAGTVFLQLSNTTPQLIVDNGGLAGFSALTSFPPLCDLQISGGAILTNVSGLLSLRNLFIGANSWYTAPTSSSSGFNVSATTATIQPGGGIITDGESSSSIGAGGVANSTGGGGGNGGNGGNGAANAFGGTISGSGSITDPVTPGAVGGGGLNGSGGNGGGIITLNIQNTLQLDGKISANGVTGPGFNSGGGAGGSILLTAGTISGAGAISANGGAANDAGGGGGGGRVAVYYKTNLFSGSFTAYGGAGVNFGGAGIAYIARFTGGQVPLPFPETPPFPQVIVDNGSNRGAGTPLPSLTGAFDLTVTGGAGASNAFSSAIQMGNLLVGSNSSLQTYPFSQQQITVSSNATILAGGSVNADGESSTSQGGGQTLNLTGGGGASAGSGGASLFNAAGGIPFFDSITLPTSLGGRGGSGSNGGVGGAGGGSLKMTVTGTLRVDGRISADGASGLVLNGGGGAGGTVSLSTTVLSGGGVISANGGAGNSAGGGGGGGHIAISYRTNSFAGSLTARGGSGANFGGAGIIYTATNPQFPGPLPQLTLDNGGTQGGYTPLFSPPQNVGLTITGGAVLTNTTSQLTFNSLFIGSNSAWLASSPSVSRTFFTILTNATIQAGGKITCDGVIIGGPSQGQSLSSGGGGGHGGYGGASLSNALGGSVTSDSITEPETGGSQGGFNGGDGGGVLQISVRGALQLDGRISTEGATSSVLNSGGGSGGAIWLTLGKLSGAGSISANGGAGNNGGGGGGGGRIAISYVTNAYAGSITARGGAGANFGGAGTIYTASGPPFGQGKPTQLIIDNGGARGTNTLVNFVGNGLDLIISNGASVALSSPPGGGVAAWNSLTISSNALLRLDPSINNLAFTVTSNLTIQPGGAIALDGQGFAAHLGSGPGGADSGLASPIGGGAGHGGYGSAGNQGTATGGGSYDSITAPTLAGSGGGASGTSGSAGGGALHLTVNGVLAVNGTLSANGTPGILSGAGGGAGGSLWLNAGTLSGVGRISVDGGDGELFGGGGGGAGGRLAVFFSTNHFTGEISARGGAGPFLSGGAGTIYLKTNSASVAQLILDDAGTMGTNTPLDTLTQTIVSLSVSNGAAASSTPALTVQNLSLGPGGLFNANPMEPLSLTVLGNASISAGGGMNADAASGTTTSPGAGAVDSYGDGSGGGYGGAGGPSFFGATGGSAYGSSNQPTSLGSSGGSFPSVPGFSQGGGAIRLNVSGALAVAGSISANGDDAIIDGSGGGSGGSIWINAQSLSGNGVITANGGMGESDEGGGGGGGRIAIYAGTNLFSGSLLARGGDGAFPGQAGTVYILTNLLVSGSITDTNGTPIAGMIVYPNNLPLVMTDPNGFYSVIVPPAWTGSIAPVGGTMFVPNSRSYSGLSSNAVNQNFLLASPTDFNFSGGQFDGTNVNFSWWGIRGVSYQPLYSTNLVNWLPYGPPILGSNAPAMLALPAANAPQMYFRLGVSY